MTKRFQRTKEDFTCENCGNNIVGTGYTNHCAKCLWSKHVDINPGDRQEPCGGLMKPVALEGTSPNYTVVQKCERCGIVRRNKADSTDDIASLLRIASST